MSCVGTILPILVLAGVVAAQPREPFVRIHDHAVRSIGPAPSYTEWSPTIDPSAMQEDVRPVLSPRAWNGQSIPGGGSLATMTFLNAATVNRFGVIAFVASVDGAARNQGVFKADANGVIPIAIGCGDYGGGGDPPTSCGDASPVGGHFGEFFQGTAFVPAINDLGDVLFFAEVDGGSESRCLFLYLSDEGLIEPIACAGDPAPGGGVITSVGVGTVNNSRQVVFLGFRNNELSQDHLYLWENGTLSRPVRIGQTAPGGGTFYLFGGEYFGFVDDTYIPIGRLADINDLGEIAFFAALSDSSAYAGVFLLRDGSVVPYVRDGDATPRGGQYLDFGSPILNNAGEVAFYADVRLGPSDYTGGWFVGQPGDWRSPLGFFDQLFEGTVNGLAFSRNPMQALNDRGDLVAWFNLRFPDGDEREHLIVARADGSMLEVARPGDPTPLGGTVGYMEAWPAIDAHGRGTLSCTIPEAPEGVWDAHFLFIPAVDFDGDADGDVDADDWRLFADCAAGPDSPPTPQFLTPEEGLDRFDSDADTDVDLSDAAAFESSFTGE